MLVPNGAKYIKGWQNFAEFHRSFSRENSMLSDHFSNETLQQNISLSIELYFVGPLWRKNPMRGGKALSALAVTNPRSSLNNRTSLGPVDKQDLNLRSK